jgi:hypothetical protein
LGKSKKILFKICLTQIIKHYKNWQLINEINCIVPSFCFYITLMHKERLCTKHKRVKNQQMDKFVCAFLFMLLTACVIQDVFVSGSFSPYFSLLMFFSIPLHHRCIVAYILTYFSFLFLFLIKICRLAEKDHFVRNVWILSFLKNI